MGSCRKSNSQHAEQQISEETIVFLNDVLPNNDSIEIIEFVKQSITIESLRAELANIEWKSVPPKSSTDFQTAVIDNTILTINADLTRMIKRIGEQYDAGDVDQASYIDTMKLLDATLTGVLNAHKQLDDSSIDQTGAILTYACLARSIVSQELIKRKFEHHASLTLEQTKVLSDISRDQNYYKLDTLP